MNSTFSSSSSFLSSQLYTQLRAEKDPGTTWHKIIKPAAGGGVDRFGSKKNEGDTETDSPAMDTEQYATGAYHSVLVEERAWTANWINQQESIDILCNLRFLDQTSGG